MQTINISGREVQVYGDIAGLALPDLSGESEANGYRTIWEQAAEQASNGLDSLLFFPLGSTHQLEVYCEQSIPASAQVNLIRDLSDAVYELHHEGLTAEHLAEWGQDGLSVLTQVSEGYDGPCRVWVQPNYYQGTYNAPRPGFARGDEFNGVLEFDTYAAAAAYADNYYNAPSGYDGIPACNVLSHGQAGSDTLTIVAAE